MKRVILTFACVLIVLAGIALLWPKDGVRIGDIVLRFPSLEEIFLNQKPQYADISKIISDDYILTSKENVVDSVSIKKDTIEGFVFANNDSTLLDNFFALLERAKDNRTKVRIVHYGDSQIEADRISSYLRTRLQNNFGGQGQGALPVRSLSQVNNVTYYYSPNFHFLSPLNSKKPKTFGYGITQSTLIPYVETVKDSLTGDSTIYRTASIELKFLKPLKQNIRLYYSNATTDCSIKVFSKEHLLNQYSIDKISSLNYIDVPINAATKSLTFEIKGSLFLHCFDISSEHGVFVDNISLRGSSGLEFSKNDADLFKQMSQMMDVKLFILQFGVNAIPQDQSVTIKSYHFYEVQLAKQIKFLKATNPDVPIIIIGVSDRSKKIGNDYQTNPNIYKLLACQKKVALENGCIFWDLFSAMGGENSMPSWVLREHPLANSDFTHFNTYGAKYVAQMFYQALQQSYNDYKHRQAKNIFQSN